MQRSEKKTIVVFSPDVDVARNLSLFLENDFDVVCESRLKRLAETIVQTAPALVLADVYPMPSDIRKLLAVLEQRSSGVLLVLLHVYRNWAPEVEEAIHKAADHVFYKPVNVELLSTRIAEFVNQHESVMELTASKKVRAANQESRDCSGGSI